MKKADVLEREQADVAARAAISELESQSVRAMREALIAVLSDGPEKARLLEVDAAVAEQRKDILK